MGGVNKTGVKKKKNFIFASFSDTRLQHGAPKEEEEAEERDSLEQRVGSLMH